MGAPPPRARPVGQVDESGGAFDPRAFLATLGRGPGVYRLLGEGGEVLYVGKARDLRRRLASYFGRAGAQSAKTRLLMRRVRSVEVTVTHTETEALLLENTLIKRLRPRFNILLRDDKSFPYLRLRSAERFPRLEFYRGARREPGRYFGPFADAGAVRETLNLLHKLFRLRQCDDAFFAHRSRPCLQHQIGRCSAPCVGLIDEHAYARDVRDAVLFLEGKSSEVIDALVARMEEAAGERAYERAALLRDRIIALRRVQERQHVAGASGDLDVVAVATGGGAAVVSLHLIRNGQSLGTRLFSPRQAAGAQAVEVLEAFVTQHYLAASGPRAVPRQILTSQPLPDAALLARALAERAGHRVVVHHRARGERARWIELAARNAELALAQRLALRAGGRERWAALHRALGLAEPIERIECFDVSHSAGEAPVASCVVFRRDGPVRSEYRRFNLREIAPGDDYAGLRQALTRRYRRVLREEAELPGLVLVDGGRGQLAVALEVARELQLAGLAIAAVAKGPSRRAGLEQIWLPGRRAPVVLAESSQALHLIQQIRDEAHRFAIAGHRARRGRRRRASPLEAIPGVGAARRRRLLAAFGGLQGVARAGIEDLCRVEGIGRRLATAIYEGLREEGV